MQSVCIRSSVPLSMLTLTGTRWPSTFHSPTKHRQRRGASCSRYAISAVRLLDPAIALSQEIVLGCYYLTEDRPSPKPAGRRFADANEARLAYDQGVIDLHTRITVRVPDKLIQDAPPPAPATSPQRGRIETTVGRLLFNELLPDHLRYRNYAMTKECLKQLVAESLASDGEDATARLADAIKQLGYHYATKSGTSFGISDMAEPPEKQALVAEGQARSQEIHALFQEGT